MLRILKRRCIYFDRRIIKKTTQNMFIQKRKMMQTSLERISKNTRNCTALEAMDCIKSGQNIYVQGAAATPTPLLEALCHCVVKNNLKNLTAYHIHMEGDGFLTEKSMIGPNCRQAIANGTADFIPIFLSKIPSLFRKGQIRLDTALIQVSHPDEHGYVSLGTSVDATFSAIQNAKTIIVFGDGVFHISNVNYAVYVDQPLHQSSHGNNPSDEENKIAEYIVQQLLEDGSTLQMGIGSVPTAVMTQIKDHKNLGIHSEMISDPVVNLIQAGIINNLHKAVYPGKTLSSFCVGTDKLFKFLHNNPQISCFIYDSVMMDVAFTNNPFIIAQNPKVVSINSCLEVDLTGQVVSDSIGKRIYSGVGGQIDFVTGAVFSNDGLGKSIITLKSLTKNGHSKIVPIVREGAGVTTSRSHVQYIVTEYGIAYLKGKNILQRAYALINVAHPKHRSSLEQSAFNRFKMMPYQ